MKIDLASSGVGRFFGTLGE